MSKRRKYHERIDPTWGQDGKDVFIPSSITARNKKVRDIRKHKVAFAIRQSAPVKVIVKNGQLTDEVITTNTVPMPTGKEASKAAYKRMMRAREAAFAFRRHMREEKQAAAKAFLERPVVYIRGENNHATL